MNTKIAVLIVMMCAAAAAQSSSGYLYFAPGGVTSSGHTAATYHAGVGVDAVVAKGIGVNLELGALWARGCFNKCVLGVFSPGGSYYFRRGKKQKLDPFVSGGYSLMFRSGRENLFYVGGGANYWFSNRVGVRLEFRDHISTHYATTSFWSFRFGAAFR